MFIVSESDVTNAVLERVGRFADERHREIMTALVKHLHEFVREVNLTEEEFRQATRLINEIGHLTTDSHNEAVLMAGTLGISTLVCLLNNVGEPESETAQNLLGPFWRQGAPETENGGSIVRSETAGDPLIVDISLIDKGGLPIQGATVDIWHAAPNGRYENEDDAQAEMNLRGRFTSDNAGRVSLRTVRFSGYPIPTHGVVGRMLAALGQHPYRPAHLHVLAFKPGYKTLITQLYDSTDKYLESDVQFGVTRGTIGTLVEHRDGRLPGVSYSLETTLVMTDGEAMWPDAPIS